MSLFIWFCPQVSILKQKAVVAGNVQNSLNQSKTGPLLQGITSFKIIKSHFFKKGNLRMNVTFHVVSSTCPYDDVKIRNESICANFSEIIFPVFSVK
jgi:hypothetical protein